MTNKRHKVTKIKCKRRESTGKESLFVELNFAVARSQKNSKLDQKKHNSNKFTSDCQINSADLVSRHPYGILGEKSQMSSAKRL